MDARALYNGASGIKAYTVGLRSVADNLANISTTGYKANRAEFQDVLSQNLALGAVQQVGNGSRVDVENIIKQGPITYTGIGTDLAISGQGFFAVSDPDNPNDLFYTRAGEFSLDKDGFLVNSQGYHLMGYAQPGVVGNLVDLEFGDLVIPAQATNLVELSINLNAADTNTHQAGQAIDPDDASTYNTALGFSVVDGAGEMHYMNALYQRLESYTGPSPAGSQTVWKVNLYEHTDDGLTANPPGPDNEFYLHFDTDGHLVGTSTGSEATADAYTYGPVLSDGDEPASDRMGEAFLFTGSGVQQTYTTSALVSFSGSTSAVQSITIGSDPAYSVAAGLSASQAAASLAAQINSDASRGYYATADDQGNVTLHSKGGGALSVAASGTETTVDQSTSLNQVIGHINNGVAASGAVHIASTASAGETVTIGGGVFTLAGTTTGDIASNLAAQINADPNLSATSLGDEVFITYGQPGAAGEVAFTTSDATGTLLVLSGATLANGLDGTADSNVVASAVSNGGGISLSLTRDDTGAAATVTPGAASTLGAALGYDFNAVSQTSAAGNATGQASAAASQAFTFDFGAAGNQNITINYDPAAYAASTFSAGASSTAFSGQDGLAAGELTDISVDEQGTVVGHFSNGETQELASVAVSHFTNPAGLSREGNNLWLATGAQGETFTGLPGDAAMGLGVIKSGGLEESTVDVALEFTNMITYQRAYQANGKAVTTGDEMLKTAINMKR